MGQDSQQQPEPAAVETIRVWDGPTRVLKWGLAAAVAAAFVLGQSLSFETIGTHFIAGYVVAGLLAARLIWAGVGAEASRLSTMARDIAALRSYLRGLGKPEPSFWPGHNPMGSLWVLALWAAVAVQVGSGLFAYSDVFFAGGPLAGSVAEAVQVRATAVHHFNAKVLVGLVALHLTAITYYAVWKNENLIGPMVSGLKRVRRRAGSERRGGA